MPGGLIQIASYGSQDLTLTGNPQITFFKIVFRRYTNFGIRTVEIPFGNPVNFDEFATIKIPKSGDLMTKATLKIKLPSYDLKDLNANTFSNFIITNSQNIDFEKYYLYYDFLINFINKLKNLVSTFFLEYDLISDSVTYIEDLKNYISTFLKEADYLQFFNIVNTFLFNDFDTNKNRKQNIFTNTFTNASLFKLSKNLLTYIYENYTEEEYSYDMFKFTISANMKILDDLNNLIYEKLLNKMKINPIIKMGWIKKIGIFIMDYVEMYIGSNLITKLTSNYIDIFGQLNYKNREIYDRMIGNDDDVNKIETYKNEKYLYTPLPFWFQNNYGLSIPLIALQFNEIQLKFKFKSLIETIYFDILNTNFSSETIKNEIIDLIISRTISIFTSQLELTLLIEYVYLDNIERKKFAQSSHEYLITQVQELTFTNVTPFYSNFELDFFHCCKTMYWYANQYKNINNLLGQNIFDKYTVTTNNLYYNNNNQDFINYLKILWGTTNSFNLSTFILGLNIFYKGPINDDFYIQDTQTALIETQNYKVYEISPFIFSQINLNGTSLISQNTSYFNFLQPYNYFKNTPNLGINVYSYALNPTETQPTGSCNLSRIPKTSINFKLFNSDEILSASIDNNNILNNLSSQNLNNYKIYVDAENYNVLRFIGGIVGVAFTY